MFRPALHFIGFKDDRYLNAVRVFGKPDFFHRRWDFRAATEIAPGDTVVFADGDETYRPCEFSFDDSREF